MGKHRQAALLASLASRCAPMRTRLLLLLAIFARGRVLGLRLFGGLFAKPFCSCVRFGGSDIGNTAPAACPLRAW
jgi:hypothetical protein